MLFAIWEWNPIRRGFHRLVRHEPPTRAGVNMMHSSEALRSLTPFRHGTLLLVTRNQQLAGTVAHALEAVGSSGPRLSTVQTLADCLVALRLLGPSLVVLDDAICPEDSRPCGLDELLQVRPGTPVIYVTSHHTLELEREVRRRGVLFYVEMPETRGELDTTLSRLVGAFVRNVRTRETA
jgi:DNA-binding NtrC family response regulator